MVGWSCCAASCNGDTPSMLFELISAPPTRSAVAAATWPFSQAAWSAVAPLPGSRFGKKAADASEDVAASDVSKFPETADAAMEKSTFAPARSSASTVSAKPSCAAMYSGVVSPFKRLSTSAPHAASALTAAARFRCAAACTARPPSVVAASASAPRAHKAWMASPWPFSAAKMSAVVFAKPWRASTSAPLLASFWMTATWPAADATCSAVRPCAPTASMRAAASRDAAKSDSTHSWQPESAAAWSAVVPSGSRASARSGFSSRSVWSAFALPSAAKRTDGKASKASTTVAATPYSRSSAAESTWPVPAASL
mmetsp:Transcript_7153/g.25036  ORF Transcript_7153/g.25036 Transcript_7153/m.25036 type:complete len:312 (-) Transcript_7153:416-1351(-)